MLPVCKPDISRQRMSLLEQSSCHSRSHYSICSTGLGKPTKKTSCLPPQNIQNLCGIDLNKLIYTLGVTLERTLTKLCCLLPSVFVKKDTKQLILRMYFYFVIWSVSYFQDPVGLTNVSTEYRYFLLQHLFTQHCFIESGLGLCGTHPLRQLGVKSMFSKEKPQ